MDGGQIEGEVDGGGRKVSRDADVPVVACTLLFPLLGVSAIMLCSRHSTWMWYDCVVLLCNDMNH